MCRCDRCGCSCLINWKLIPHIYWEFLNTEVFRSMDDRARKLTLVEVYRLSMECTWRHKQSGDRQRKGEKRCQKVITSEFWTYEVVENIFFLLFPSPPSKGLLLLSVQDPETQFSAVEPVIHLRDGFVWPRWASLGMCM